MTDPRFDGTSKEMIDLSKVIAFDPSRPVPTLKQLKKMDARGVTPHIIRRDDGTLLFVGATNADGDNVDNDCRLL
jgi:hypothetical protein